MKTYRNYMVFLAFFVFSIPSATLAETVTVYAAGSLKAALSEVIASYQQTYGTIITTQFGPSGLLRKAIEEGGKPDIFASADMIHPEKLASNGWGSPVVMFTRNQLCAIAQPHVEVTTANLYATLLDKNIRVGTSTPKADPSGDYAWELFQKADKIKEGSFATLSVKALQLTGGPDSIKAPDGRNQYGWVMNEKKADIFLTYCTNALLAQKEVPPLKIIRIPEELSVGADYGLIVRDGAMKEAWRLAMYILSPIGQNIMKKHGFEATGIPK